LPSSLLIYSRSPPVPPRRYVDYFLVKPVARGVVLVAGDRAGSFTERVLATGSSVVADGGEESEEEEAEGENKV